MNIRTLFSLALAVLAAGLAPAAQAQQLLYIHADHLNTPRMVTNGTGTPVWRWDQTEPFGDNPPNEDPDGNGILGHMPLRFPGQYFDKETNLAYNYYRDYDPATGRYIQSDPIGVAGLATTTGRIPSTKDFAASWFSTLPSAGAINFRAVMSLPLIETPMVNDLPRWSGLSLYSYVEGNPLIYIDADALIPKPPKY